ncbi:hypothetical protein [Dysosmobacter sp.]|uniref:hypothetical protein n=1 Tax=Dysosmobacter sp. TaxID=2591382 RepID=UPI003A92C7A4
MRAERLFSILGLVDPELVEEAMASNSSIRARRAAVWGRYMAIAACCVIVCGALFWSVRFLGMGGGSDSAATSESTAADTADGADSGATGGADAGGDNAAQEPGQGFLSYAGPVLPLTTAETDTGLTAERTLTFDFAPGSHADGTSGQWGATVSDRYLLTNPTDTDISVTALYPLSGGLSDLSAMAPRLTVDGAETDYTLYAGGYAGTFGDENDHDGSTWNLAGPYDWEDYAALVSDRDYLTGALAAAPDLDTPVIVYDFSDVTLTGEAEDPELVVSCIFDPENTTIFSYGFSSSDWDASGTWRQYGQRVDPDRWGCPTLIVLGEDMDYTLLGDYGLDAPALTGADCTVTRKEATLGEALRSLCRTELANQANSVEFSLDLYVKAVAELLTEYGLLSDSPMDRYADGRLDDLLDEALTIDRVLYLAVPVTVPAGESLEVSVSFWKRPSYDFGGSGTGREELQGFDLLTTAGSALTFTGQYASAVHTDGVTLVRQDLGLDWEAGTTAKAALDLNQPHYSLEICPLEN